MSEANFGSNTLPIPERYRAQCEMCRRDVDTRKEGTHQFTSGWVMVRSGGGGHSISLPKRENRWACAWCVREQPGQAKLFV